MKRVISYTEQSTLLTCQAQWDFNYGGYLAGDCLRPKAVPQILQEGRAWGIAVATFHSTREDKLDAAITALTAALTAEAEKLDKAGFYDAAAHRDMAAKLRALLEQYAQEDDNCDTSLDGLTGLETELIVPLPSRSGTGDSNRYGLQVFFDGILDRAEGEWLVEFKLRGQLSPLELIANSRQIRYYAWARQRESGRAVRGVIVDERLNASPKPARWVRPRKKSEGVEFTPEQAAAVDSAYNEKEEEALAANGTLARRTVSHAKDQMTTPESYLDACKRAGVEPVPETLEEIASRRWSQRQPIFLTPTEIEESGRELISLGRQIAAIDSGQVYPVRNPKPQNCNGCRFREICNEPKDKELVDVLFDRRPAKRNRTDEEVVPA